MRIIFLAIPAVLAAAAYGCGSDNFTVAQDPCGGGPGTVVCGSECHNGGASGSGTGTSGGPDGGTAGGGSGGASGAGTGGPSGGSGCCCVGGSGGDAGTGGDSGSGGDAGTGGDSGSGGDGGPPCTPFTSAMCGANTCGNFPDNCGGTFSCGTCPAWANCTSMNGGPQTCVCTSPKTCAGIECGDITSCGSTISCGTCSPLQQCGLKVANKCDGCTNYPVDNSKCGGLGPKNISYLCVGFTPPLSHCASMPGGGSNEYCCDI